MEVGQMATLVVVEGEPRNGCFRLAEALVSVGRDDVCTVQILDQSVSRKHLQIRYEAKDKRHYAGDYRSANGVFVNGRQITSDVPLADGDCIRIGGTTLAYLADDHADGAAAAEAARRKTGEWKRSTIMKRD